MAAQATKCSSIGARVARRGPSIGLMQATKQTPYVLQESQASFYDQMAYSSGEGFSLIWNFDYVPRNLKLN